MPRSRASDLHGFLAIDKPRGWSSHDVVARVRRLAGVRRVGHAGTLDPFATGLLVVGVGRATRLIQYIQNTVKVYTATVKLGEQTDTLDPEGEVIARIDPAEWPSRQDVEQAVRKFVGTIDQVPPAYSAIHIGGKRAYELARKGEEVDMPARSVTIESIDIDSYDPPLLDLTIACQAGTYIRSLARDIGMELGTCGYCLELRRASSGSFNVDNSLDISGMEGSEIRDRWSDIAIPPDRAVERFPVISLSSEQTTAWYHGQPLPDVPGDDSSSLVRAYSADGTFAGLGTFEDESGLRPVLVFTAG